MSDLVTLSIDGREARVPKGTSVIEAAKSIGIAVPAFCYHAKMKAVGACRMCLVEIEKMPKLQTACTTPVGEGMVVSTNAPRVIQAQHSVVEFLLINHPLDCPVCDKGGECPLQDTTFGWGLGTSRYDDPKRRFVKPVDLSPEIKLDRERCIMCLRCVRFTRELAGDESLIIAERGNGSEVATAPGRTFDSPFSGNTIEICPVGALTSARFRFRARIWDLTQISTVCDKCAVGCNMRLQVRAPRNELLRLWSRENLAVDDGWLCDRGRFDYEYVNSPDRLTTPLVRKNGELAPASWDEALAAIRDGFRRVVESHGGTAVGAIGNPRGTNEEAYLLQKVFRAGFGTNNLDYTLQPHAPAAPLPLDAATGTIAGLERAGAVLVVGANPLVEAPIVDLRLKKAAGNGTKLFVVGPEETDLARYGRYLRVRPSALADVVRAVAATIVEEGLHDESFVAERTAGFEDLTRRYADFGPEAVAERAGIAADVLRDLARAIGSARPLAIVYRRDLFGGLDREGEKALADALYNLSLLTGSVAPTEEQPGGGLYPLRLAANEQGCFDAGLNSALLPGQRATADDDARRSVADLWRCDLLLTSGTPGAEMLGGGVRALYLAGHDPLGAEGAEMLRESLAGLDFLVVQDVFLTETAKAASVVLPGVTWAEMDGTFTNFDRRVQRLRPGIVPPGEARPGWQVLRDLGLALGVAGCDFGSPQEVFAELGFAAPIYGGLTYGRLGDAGARWPVRLDGALAEADHIWAFATDAGRRA